MTEQRFWAKVDKSGDCWLWTGAVTSNGYGSFSANGRSIRAHRFAYESLVGAIPEGLQIDHLCRVRLCVNPAHMEPVTQRENIMRGEGATAVNGRKEVCKHGHELTPENIRWDRRGGRNCRICRREDHRRYYARHRTEFLAKQYARRHGLTPEPSPEKEKR